MQGVLDAYQYAIRNVRLFGPTNFSPIIQRFAQIAATMHQNGKNYYILLIITDGIITDMEQTKAAIVKV